MRKLEIKPPNQVIFDHKRHDHDALTREFLEVREFLMPPTSDPPTDATPSADDEDGEDSDDGGHDAGDDGQDDGGP
jgi:hypothetical protein